MPTTKLDKVAMTDSQAMPDNVLNMDKESNPTVEKIEKTFLTCPVCFEVFTRPKCLPCLHTFCSHCLLSYIESKDMYGIRRDMGFSCPVCKQFTSIRNYHKPYRAWLNEIQNNFLIQNMIDSIVPTHHEDTEHSDDEESDTHFAITPYVPVLLGDLDELSTRDVSPLRILSPSRPPVTASGLDVPVSDLLKLYSSQYGLTQQWAASPCHRPFGPFGEPAAYGDESEELIPRGRSPLRRTVDVSALLSLNPNISFSQTNNLQQTYQMAARNWLDYKPPKLSDVICMPRHNSIIALDYDNRYIKYVKNVFLGRNVTTAMEVIGRPCSVALLDENTEDRVVVSVLNRNKLYFIHVPEFSLIDVMDTRRSYRGLTVLSPTAILAGSPGSPGKPACIDLIRIDHRCKMISSETIYRNGCIDGVWNWDLHLPHYITAVSATSFIVSDTRKNGLVYFDIVGGTGSTKAVKRFTLTLPKQMQPRQMGGMCYHEDCVYFVDAGVEEVYKVILNEDVECETILKPRNGVKRPSSVCVGPGGEICVVDWEGKVRIYKPQQARNQ